MFNFAIFNNLYFKNLKIFEVNRIKNNFFIKSIKYKNDFNYIIINVDKNDLLNKFIIKKKKGETIICCFINKRNVLIDKKIFNFILPKNFSIDDQRFLN